MCLLFNNFIINLCSHLISDVQFLLKKQIKKSKKENKIKVQLLVKVIYVQFLTCKQ